MLVLFVGVCAAVVGGFEFYCSASLNVLIEIAKKCQSNNNKIKVNGASIVHSRYIYIYIHMYNCSDSWKINCLLHELAADSARCGSLYKTYQRCLFAHILPQRSNKVQNVCIHMLALTYLCILQFYFFLITHERELVYSLRQSS